jgi:hypothetical protein
MQHLKIAPPPLHQRHAAAYRGTAVRLQQASSSSPGGGQRNGTTRNRPGRRRRTPWGAERRHLPIMRMPSRIISPAGGGRLVHSGTGR